MNFKQNNSSGLTQEIRVRRCYGCGAILQDQDPNEVGFVPTDKFTSDGETLCERCFKLRHYSKFRETPSLNIDYVTILDSAKESESLAVYVMNAFSLDGSILEGVGKYLPHNTLVVINKRDLLPKAYADEYLIRQAKSLLSKEGIEPKEILITSSGSKASNIDQLMNAINKYRENKNVYFIGAYQVGKSSLINSLLMSYNNSTDKIITTSPYPGTTLDVISIPLDDNSYIFDTPGINNSRSIVSVVEPNIMKYVLPRNEIKPETYAAKSEQSFLLSNLLRVDFVKGDKTNFTFFKSNDLTIARAKLNKADAAFNSMCHNLNDETCSHKISSIDNMNKHTFTAIANTTNRIAVCGLCFIEFNGSNQTIEVYAPIGVNVQLFDTSIKG